MLAGGAGLLLWSVLAGELLHPVPISERTLWAWVYLVLPGSVLAFSAFVYLLSRLPASQVSSYAYVNPVVAVLLGHFLGGEQLTRHTLIGGALVVGSVFVTLQGKAKLEQAARAESSQPVAAGNTR
jgi:drug/metabolite transporter (DMT)-like permease